jgi:hypothetical protein
MVAKKPVKPKAKRVPVSKPKNKHIPIDWEEVDKYLVAGCSGEQISAVVGCHSDTLYRRCVSEKEILFAEYAANKRQKGNSMLHAKQFQQAMKGDRGMLIWLGKQRLGQREEPQNPSEFNGKLAEILDHLKGVKDERDFKKE